MCRECDASPGGRGKRKPPWNLERLEKNISALTVIHHHPNKGINFALVSGFTKASGDWIFFNSADKQTPMSHMLKMLPLTYEYDLIIGAHVRRNDPTIRIVFSRIYHRLIRLLFGLNYHNINAIKLFKRNVFDQNYPWSRNLCFDLELVLQATLNNFRVCEIELEHFHRAEGKSTVLTVKNIVVTSLNLIVLWIKNIPNLARYKLTKNKKNNNSKRVTRN